MNTCDTTSNVKFNIENTKFFEVADHFIFFAPDITKGMALIIIISICNVYIICDDKCFGKLLVVFCEKNYSILIILTYS